MCVISFILLYLIILIVFKGGLAPLTAEELSVAVEQCKELVMESTECSEERKWLVRRLIELRYQLQEAIEKEGLPEEEILETAETRVVLGHHLILHYQPASASNRICDQCSRNIWTVVQPWYQCSGELFLSLIIFKSYNTCNS